MSDMAYLQNNSCGIETIRSILRSSSWLHPSHSFLRLLIDHGGSGITSSALYALSWSLSGTGEASTTLAASSALMGLLSGGRGAGSTSTSLAGFAESEFRFPAHLKTPLTWETINAPFAI